MTSADLRRTPAWLGEGGRQLLGWFHDSPPAGNADTVAVICGPVGYEYTRAHRTLRHLADRLARAGVPTLRFDYHGIGDSAGDDLDAGRVAAWQASIRTAIAAARAWSGCERVCLVGVRLGGSLAAMVACDTPVDGLVLWNPCVTGRPYLRELQAIAASAERDACGLEGVVESAGFAMTRETREAVAAIDLAALRPAARRALLLWRDDAAADDALGRHLAALGIACDSRRVPGWAGMMAEHQFTVVPDAALAQVVDWVREKNWCQTPVSPGKLVSDTSFCRFGPGERLFGILERAGGATDRPVVVMINAGAVHHVGPNRIYVELARRLAQRGVPSLRFDLEGIGDSVLAGPGRENHPYPDTAVRDTRAAIDYLRARHGYSRFVALGLCSGAHHAFHAGIEIDDPALEELVLVNPLTFRWQEGMSLETTTRLYDELAYRRSMRDPARWRKLLRGDVNFGRLFQVVAAYPKSAARTCYDTLTETLAPAHGPRLARDLTRLLATGRRCHFLIAEGDPGRQLLMAGAPRTAARALRSGAIGIESIPGADHTFSQRAPRADLFARLERRLAPASADGAAVVQDGVAVAQQVAARGA